MINKVIKGDCLEVMKDIPDKSIDMILCDLPYGTTACKWDTIIPFEPLWEQYKRIIKDNGAIVLTASQPFTSALVMSNIKMFKYEWIWEKEQGSNFTTVNHQPFKAHENILVFSNGKITYNPIGNYMKYNPQKTKGKPYSVKRSGKMTQNLATGANQELTSTNNESGDRHPLSYQYFQRDTNKIHPTQKPVALFEYLIKTYTNEGDLVLDNCAGSFTTSIASENLKRNWICIEKESEYCAIGEKRIKENRERQEVWKTN